MEKGSKCLYKCYYDSEIGRMIMFSDGVYLVGLDFVSSRFIEKLEEKSAIYCDNLDIFVNVKEMLDSYFAGNDVFFNQIPILLNGSVFCERVWDFLKTIPYGETMTYGEIANVLKKKYNLANMSAQAVGYAVGHNPISIIVPCHRVMGAGGKLTGYGGGIDKKIALLVKENIDVSNFK